MRHMSRRHMARGGFDVAALIVEEDVGAEGPQEFAFVESAQKKRFIDANVPGAQGADDALVRGRSARGDEGGAYG